MSDAGYTLAEMLAALVIVSLAVGGLSAGLTVLGRLQASEARDAAELNALHAGQVGLVTLVSNDGPFRSGDAGSFTGDSTHLQFPCGSAKPCEARLVPAADGNISLQLTPASGQTRSYDLHDPGPLTFAYVSTQGATAAWPPSDASRQTLRSVSVLRPANGSASQAVILEARVWAEQPIDCAFDPVMQDCR